MSTLRVTNIQDLAGNDVFSLSGGNMTVAGNLTVQGTTTSIETTNLTIEDKNIVLGLTDPAATDATTDGGGITLKGTTDKTIAWVDGTNAWTSSEHIDIANGKEFHIAGTSVLSATALGTAVVSSSLTSVGTITSGTWQGTAINASYLDSTVVTTSDSGTVTSTMILDGTIVNGDINASAAIAGTKISPDFGSQNIITTGDTFIGTATNSGIAAKLLLKEGNFKIDTVANNEYAYQLLFSKSRGAGIVQAGDALGNIAFVGNDGVDLENYAAAIRVDADNVTVNATSIVSGRRYKIATVGDTNFVAIGAASNTVGVVFTATGTGSGTGVVTIEPSANSMPGRLVFSTTSHGSISPSERMRIDSSGNVGIGTGSPDTKLNVEDLTEFTLNTNTIDYTVFLEGGNTSGQDNYGASIGFSRINGGTRTGAVIATKQTSTDADQQGLSFLTHNSSNTNSDLKESMLITHDGNVGIGTASPSQKLDVTTTVAAPDQTIWSAANLVLKDDSAFAESTGGAMLFQGKFNSSGQYSTYGYIRGGKADSTDGAFQGNLTIASRSGSIIFANGNDGLTDGSNELVRITSSGNVGIGTDNPGAKLDVRAGSSALGINVEGRGQFSSSPNWNFSGIRVIRSASNTPNVKLVSFMLDGDSESDTDLYAYPNIVLRTNATPTTSSTSEALAAKLEITAPTGVDLGVGTKPILKTTSGGVDVNGSITESTDGGTTYHNVVTAQDIGTAPNEVPLNQFLGQMAFMDEVGDIPTSSSAPQENLSVNFEYVSNTSIKIRMRGSDGVVRSATLTLS